MSGAISDAALLAKNLWDATDTIAQIFKDFVELKALYYTVKEQLFAATYSHRLLKAVCTTERLVSLNDVLSAQKLALSALKLNEFIDRLELQYGSPPDSVQLPADSSPMTGIGRLIDPSIEVDEKGKEDEINRERLKHPLDHIGAALDVKTWTKMRLNLQSYLNQTYGRALSDPITTVVYAASDKKKIAEAMAGLENIKNEMLKWFSKLDPEPLESLDDVGTNLPQAVVLQPSAVDGEMVTKAKPSFLSRIKNATLHRRGVCGDDFIYGTFEPVFGNDFKLGDRVSYKKRGNDLIQLVFVKGDVNGDDTNAVVGEWRIQGIDNGKTKPYAKCVSACLLPEHAALSEWEVLEQNGHFRKMTGFTWAVDDHVHLLEKKDRDRRINAFVSTPMFDTYERAKMVIELVTDKHVLGQVGL